MGENGNNAPTLTPSPHVQVPVLRPRGREPETTLADGEGGYSKPTRKRTIRVPVELGIVVGVQVNGPRSDDAAAGVELSSGSRTDPPADHRNPSVLYPQVCLVPGNASPIHDGAATNDQVVLSHDYPDYPLPFTAKGFEYLAAIFHSTILVSSREPSENSPT